MIHALSLIMPYGAYLAPLLKKLPIEELNKIYAANMQHAIEYNHMEDRAREATNEMVILRRRLASFEREEKNARKPQHRTSRHKNSHSA